MDWQNLLVWSKGGISPSSKGALTPLTSNPLDGALYTQEGGKHRAAALAGRLYSACNAAVVTTVAGVTAAAWTGLGIANPASTNTLIILHEFYFVQWVIATGEGALGLAVTSDSGFAAAITPQNRLLGGPASKAYVDDGATITPAGVVLEWVASVPHGAATVQGYPGLGVVDLHGGIVIPPGKAVVTDTDIVQTSVFTFGFLWEEIPI